MLEPRVSVVVPVFDEEGNVEPLVRGVRRVLDEGPNGGTTWELVFVDDGSRDGTADAVRRAIREDSRVGLVRLARNYGQTTAMQAGFDHARGEVVVSMDGDLQNDPEDIPRLLGRLEEGFDLVAGYREARKDRLLTRKVPSWVANRLIRLLTGIPIRDNGCSLRAYRRSVIEGVRLYADMHRFVPVVAAATASARIAEIPVRHHPRRHGRSKYGLSRVWKVLADLLTITMIRWFRERPLALFGWGAMAAGAVATLFVAGAVADVVFGPPRTDALVLPGTALLLFGLAGYLLMLGLVAEVAVRDARREGGALGAGARDVGR